MRIGGALFFWPEHFGPVAKNFLAWPHSKTSKFRLILMRKSRKISDLHLSIVVRTFQFKLFCQSNFIFSSFLFVSCSVQTNHDENRSKYHCNLHCRICYICSNKYGGIRICLGFVSKDGQICISIVSLRFAPSIFTTARVKPLPMTLIDVVQLAIYL